MDNLNLTEYKDKVYACWLGKNIGGTLGAPFEGQQCMNDCTFYVQERTGEPAPNDDLDIQLVWLNIVEKHGLFNITPRLIGDYWAKNVTGPWNEYSVANANIRNGFYPPLSGSVNNDPWKYSNGAWIRSEIWACLCPGNPDEAIRMAYIDSCIDHCGEGIYAEMFTAALESAAFVCSDLRKLISIGLSKIPSDSQIAKYVTMVCDYYDKGLDWKEVRDLIVEDNLKGLGWFQAPANIAFATIGLLYGNGDFGKTICLAVNCGDDTDCTGATAGAIMGIMYGRKGIPDSWLEPIGEKIVTGAISKFGLPVGIPATIGELTGRTVRAAIETQASDMQFIRLSDNETTISAETMNSLCDTATASEIWARSPYELSFPIQTAEIAIDYENPVMETGVPVRVSVHVRKAMIVEGDYRFRWHLPEGWATDIPEGHLLGKDVWDAAIDFTITPGTFEAAIIYPTLEVRLPDRNYPVLLSIPFECKGAVDYPKAGSYTQYCRESNRLNGVIRNFRMQARQ